MKEPEPDLSKYYFKTPGKPLLRLPKGISEKTVKEISAEKGEPDWMLRKRLDAYNFFVRLPMPKFGPDLSHLNFDEITYYIKPSEQKARRWEDVPQHIRDTFEKLGVPESERKFLAGVEAMFESEAVYQGLRKEWEEKGIIFTDTDTAVREYPEILKKHFGTVVTPADNKFSALNTAVWSGGSFLVIPKGVKLEIPVQAYFRINAKAFGQFERTMIICEPGSKVHYTEGCFLKGTPIMTAEGEKNIEDITKGDTVFSHLCRHCPVHHTQVRKYSGKIYTIHYYGDSSEHVSATQEHPFLAVKREISEYKNKDWKQEWIAAKDLRKFDYLSIPINRTIVSKNFRTFEVEIGRGRHGFITKTVKIRTDQDFFRLIGYYLAKGSSVNDHYLVFTFNKNEMAYLRDVKQLLCKYFSKAPLEASEYKGGISVVLCSTIASRLFRSLFGKRADGKTLPKWVLQESPSKQSELVKGYWRGDGSFMHKKYLWGLKRAFRINTISRSLVKQIRSILLRLDVFPSLNVWKRSKPRHDAYCLFIGGEFLDQFSKIVGLSGSANKYVARVQRKHFQGKTSFAKITREYAFVPIRRITTSSHRNTDVYNFGVEGDESYVAGGVAVHNCTAPIYSEASLHAAVVECIAKKNSHLRYTTIQNWSTNIYNLVTKRAFAYENALVEWVDGNIGCLAGDTNILSASKGKILMQELKKGDDIFCLDPDEFRIKKCVITAFASNGKKNVYELHVGGRKIVATANHPFMALTKHRIADAGHIKYSVSWKQLGEIRKGDYVAYVKSVPDLGKPFEINFKSKYEKNKVGITLPEKTNADFMWLLGFYLGDGYIWRPKNKKSAQVYFAAPTADKSRSRLIEVLKLQLNANLSLKEKVVVLSSLAFAQLIEHLGLSGNAHTKRVPAWVYTLPVSQRLAFIEGYLDADGSVSTQHKQIIFTSCNKPLLEDFQLLAVSCGLTVYGIRTYSEKRKLLERYEGCYTYHQFCLSKGDLQQIRSRIACAEPSIEFGHVTRIEDAGTREVYDIEVNGAHNFVANGIIVHNSGINMKYPSVYLKDKNARAEFLSIAYAGKGQYQDAGARAIHEAENTTSIINSKNIAKNGGIASFRGTVHFGKKAKNAKSSVKCDALLLDSLSKNITHPLLQSSHEKSTLTHEAKVGKISEAQVFYLMSRGLSESEATSLIVLGFMEQFIKELPLEYAVEFNRLVQLEIEKKLG